MKLPRSILESHDVGENVYLQKLVNFAERMPKTRH